MFKRITSLVLALTMVLSIVPAQAFAAETATVEETVAETIVTEPTEAEAFPVTEEPEETTTAPTETEQVPETEPTEASEPETVPEEMAAEVTVDAGTDGIIASGTCGDDVTWLLDHEGKLTISGTGAVPYPDGGMPWASHAESIYAVEVQYGVTSLPGSAFYGYENLTDVAIADSVAELGANIFDGCYQLKSIVLPASITEIPYASFSRCTGLETIRIPDNVTTIGTAAFDRCISLQSVQLPANLEILGSIAFADCSSLSEVSLPEGTKLLAFSVFSGCTGLRSLTVPKSVTTFWQYVFDRCHDLVITFAGDAPSFHDSTFATARNVTAYYPDNNATWTETVKKGYGGAITWVPYDANREYITEYHEDVSYYSEMTSNANELVHLDYEDRYFQNSSYTYNHDLAKASLKLAMSAFVYQGKHEGGINGAARNAYDFLQKIGCAEEDIQDYNYDKTPKTDSIACVIGSKPLSVGETLVIVAIRGQGYGAEWGGNFRVGPGLVYHQGFEVVADQVLTKLKGYIISRKEISGNIKLWITGYSRAAATANIVAGKLINGEAELPPQVSLSNENLFAYTFETPAGVKASCNPHAEKYHNIFNIINSTDFVPKVAPGNWGYRRFGIDCFLPDLSGKDYPEVREKYEKLVDDIYKTPFGTSQNTALRQSLFLDLAVDKIGQVLGGELEYIIHTQMDLIDSCANHNGLPALEELFSVYLLFKAYNNMLPVAAIVYTIINHADQIKFGHYPENCLAMMETLTDESSYTNGKYKYYIVKCPVDIFVRDDSGNTVASIENDAVSQLGNENVEVFVDENGDKYVFVLDEANYELQLTATDNGEMDCTIVSYQQGEGKTSQSAFFDIPLVAGESYLAPFSMEDDNYVLYGENETFTPDAVTIDSELYSATVAVNVVGNGEVSGAAECYTVGDTVQMVAKPKEGSIFAGWYENDELVCKDEQYSFGLRNDCTLTAVFLSLDVVMELDQEYIAISLDPEENTKVQLNITITPEEWKQFVSWSVETVDSEKTVIAVDDNGVITALELGTAYAIATASYEEYVFSARCRIDVAATDIEEPEKIRPEGVQLNTTKATTELYSTDYTDLEILLKLPQNYTMSEQEDVKDNGIAIDSARFTDNTMAELFRISVLDDRRVQIVPTDYAVENPKQVKSKYTGTVTVTVQGVEYETNALNLTVKQTKPKLKASIVAFNSFYAGQAQEITVTGGTVTGIALDASKTQPNWLDLEEDSLVLNENAPRKSVSAKAYLLVETEEWRIPAAVTLSVKNSYKVPGVKLAASSVTVSNLQKSASVELQLLCTNKVDVLKNLNITDITAPEGYSVENFNAETGTFTLKSANGFKAGKLTLKVTYGDITKSLSLTVKTQAVKLKLSASKVTLNKDLKDTASVAVTVVTGGYAVAEPVLTFDDTKLDVRYSDGKLTVGLQDGAEYGKTYPVTVRAYEGAPAVKLSIAVPKKTAVIMSTIKATGTLDVIREGTAITVKPTYTNVANVDVDKDAVLKIYSSADKYKTVIAEVKAEDGIFVIDNSVISNQTLKYKAQLETAVCENEEPVKSAMISLSVKMGAAKLTVKTSGTTLFAKDKHDRALVWFEAKDAALNEVSKVEIKDAKYQDKFEIFDYGNGQFAIGFRDGVDESLIGKTVTLNLNVFIEGNQTAKANATAKVKLTIVK